MSAISEPPAGALTSPALRTVFSAYCRYAAGTSRMLMAQVRSSRFIPLPPRRYVAQHQGPTQWSTLLYPAFLRRRSRRRTASSA